MARWKARSALPVGSLLRSSRSNSKKASWIAASCAALRRIAASSRRFDLDGQAHLEHVERDRIARAHLRCDRPECRRDVLDDEHAGALARLDEAFGRQLGQRFADHGAADAKGCGQLALGGQLLARLDLASLQLLADRRDHAFGELGFAFDPEGG